jgi:hypothetical protein
MRDPDFEGIAAVRLTKLAPLVAAGLYPLIIARRAIAQQSVEAAPAQEENSGQDPTRPVTRVDVRLKYQDNPGGFEDQILTVRADKPFLLGGGWKLSTRGDIPILRSNTATPENLSGHYKLGLGDILIQALFVTPPHGKAAFAFGTQMIVPTGTDDQFTTGKWQLAPTAAAVYQLPEISRGTFVALLVRDTFSFAAKNDRARINVLSVNPIFNWQLRNAWFLTLGPEAKFNARDHWKLFVPFDATMGKKIGPRTVISLQGDVGIIKEFPQYDWQVEFRVGFFL